MADTPSLADRLREKRQALTEEREPKLFELPGYGKELQVKYRVLSREERKAALTKAARGVRNDDDRAEEKVMCRNLGLACLGFYAEVDGKTVPLHEAEGLGDEPITWGDPRLLEVLGIPAEEVEEGGKLQTRRVIEVALGSDDDILEAHHARVGRWMERIWEDDDEDF